MKLEVLDRGFHTLDITMADGKLKQFKIPSELTVGEIERLLETQAKMEKLADEQVTDGGSAQLRLYWGYIFNQLEIIFKHYNPEITVEYLRDNILPTDAMRILGFFSENRFIEKESEDSFAKKKLK